MDAVCPRCANTDGQRIDWRFIGDALRRDVFSLEHGMLHTMVWLLLRPGRVIGDYLSGRRAAYAKPLWLLVSTAALVVLLNRLLPGTGAIADFHAGTQAAIGARPDAAGDAGRAVALLRWLGASAAANLSIVTLLLVPLEAAALKLAFWRGARLNYPEWLTVTAFLTAQTFLLWSIGIALRGVFAHAELWATQLAVGWFLYSLVRSVDSLPWWNALLRGAFGLALYVVGASVAIGLVVLAVFLLLSAG
ncbi:hypothetical protein BEN78_09425 [Xanthomonas citri pv. mangiferaeindicae]|nr:hypothetical protein BEN78_09425 [Xanthomonas citri pv. mangiferaeindicae]